MANRTRRSAGLGAAALAAGLVAGMTGVGDGRAEEPPRAKPVRPGPAPEASPARGGAKDGARTACERELARLGARFERIDPVIGEGGCGVSRPYNVRQIAHGVSLAPDTILTCEAALATARWVRDAVVPAARAMGGGARLSAITHATTYDCRGRNNQPDAKLSEHAKGTAIDISGFGFVGHEPIAVMARAGRGTIEEAFQRAVRAAACLHFTTVIGPGADAFHDDHLHLDLARRSRGYRLCQ